MSPPAFPSSPYVAAGGALGSWLRLLGGCARAGSRRLRASPDRSATAS
jgi:hypothetical protein